VPPIIASGTGGFVLITPHRSSETRSSSLPATLLTWGRCDEEEGAMKEMDTLLVVGASYDTKEEAEAEYETANADELAAQPEEMEKPGA
jgi:hypothetical protein